LYKEVVKKGREEGDKGEGLEKYKEKSQVKYKEENLEKYK